jgi:hypothetical protein
MLRPRPFDVQLDALRDDFTKRLESIVRQATDAQLAKAMTRAMGRVKPPRLGGGGRVPAPRFRFPRSRRRSSTRSTMQHWGWRWSHGCSPYRSNLLRS